MPLSKTFTKPVSILLSASFALTTPLSISACMGGGDSSTPTNETDVAPAELDEALAPDAPQARGTVMASTAAASVTGDSTAGAPAASNAESTTAHVCRSLMARGRDCSAVFLPALVAERVRLDLPAGIAAYAAKVGDDALLSEALDEYADDSKGERIASMCAELAGKLPVERRERLVSGGQACLDLDGCYPFVACAVSISLQP